MNDSILGKYTGANRSANSATEADSSSANEGTEDCGAFGFLRGIRDRAIMLELRKKDGDVVAIGYGWLERVDFDASGAITLHAMGRQFRIRGRNLNGDAKKHISLFNAICRHRVPWIQEIDQVRDLQTDTSAAVVETIEY